MPLQHSEMRRVIEEEGGSILFGQQTITRVEDLPKPEDLVDDPQEYDRIRTDLEAQRAEIDARLGRLGAPLPPGFRADPSRVTHPHSAGRPPEGQALPQGDQPQSGTDVSVLEAPDQTFVGSRVVATSEEAQTPQEAAQKPANGGRRSRAAEPNTVAPDVNAMNPNIPAAPGDTPVVKPGEPSPLPPAAQEAAQAPQAGAG